MTRAELTAEKWRQVETAWSAFAASRTRVDGLRLLTAVALYLPHASDEDET